jgi:DNA-binding GntR family transcriptional regulator
MKQPMVRSWLAAVGYSSPGGVEVERHGREAGWSYISRTEVAATEVRRRLALPAAAGDVEDVVHTDYVLVSDGEPAMLATSWEPLPLTRGTPIVLPEDGMHAGRGVAERMLSIGVVVDDWVEEVGARPGTVEELDRLQRPAGSVVITIARTYYSGEQPVETADLVIPADSFTLLYSGRMGNPTT